MPLAPRVLAVLGLLSSTACFPSSSHTIERPVTRSFAVAPGSLVHVQVSGGSITATPGDVGRAEITLTARVRADSDAEADEVLREYDVVFAQDGSDVKVSARRKPGSSRGWTSFLREFTGASFKATLTVPADVQLDLDTSGGTITVRGDRTALLRADTSGGSITVDGGRGDLALDTSGGSIKVGRALGSLRADTSGGSITVQYVGPAAREVDLDTSGGGIRVGVDPRASLKLEADTSGGGVSIDGLPLEQDTRERSHASGTLNDGKGRLRANTSGGSIRISAADDAAIATVGRSVP